MQVWQKLGLIFDVKTYSRNDWMHDYAAVPFVEERNDNILRIHFTTRNKLNKSLPAWAEFDKNDLFKGALKLSDQPLINIGNIGTFDEDGVMGCHITKINGKKYFYYIGWNRAVSVPFKNAIGLAVETEKDYYTKISEGPILDRSIYDKCFVASNCVLFDKGIFKMYYLSCNEWISSKQSLEHKYNIKYAESKDGIHWNRKGIIAIDFKYENEYAISVPRVIKDNEIYKMWYSYRGGPNSEFYNIGYAESKDGIDWDRKDQDIIFEGLQEDWDKQMMCYPYIFKNNNKLYMLYNGNDYGRTGFGLAVLKHEF